MPNLYVGYEPQKQTVIHCKQSSLRVNNGTQIWLNISCNWGDSSSRLVLGGPS